MRASAIPLLFCATLLLVACGEDDGPGPDAAPDARTDAGDATSLSDGGTDASSPDAEPPYDGPTRYPAGRVSSPISTTVVERMQAVYDSAATPEDDVFMKVGASGTVSSNLLYCFAGSSQPQYDLTWDGRDALQSTVDWFRGGDAAGDTPFDRPSAAAEVGRTAAWVQTGSPSPLAQEIAALQPRFAFVNYGTNDMQMGTTHRSALFPFYEALADLLDLIEGQGIIPFVWGLNPRTDTQSAARWVPTYDAVIRGMAEARQLPFVSLYLAARELPDQGLVSDGVHGNAYSDGTSQPCVFSAAALQFNYNVRNLLSAELLDVVRRTLLEDEAAPDAAVLPPAGAGTADDPVVVDELPFTHAADTTSPASDSFDGYPSCDTGQDESGGEVVYRLVLTETTPLRILVLDRGDVDIDLHLLGASATAESCLDRDDRILETTLDAGTHHLVLDTYVPSDGVPRAGEYLLVVVRCAPDDLDCQ